MKEGIHPKYETTTFQCACGAVFSTRSTLKKDVQVDICSACHPFFTGKQKFVDTAGRIDRLKKKFGSKIAFGAKKKPKEVRPAASDDKKQNENPAPAVPEENKG